ncbi:MAG: dihydrofolate reductase [Paludibacteraceae bacterium]|nr:dihydrofolate reductase [Paludibacteraceae bacterium]
MLSIIVAIDSNNAIGYQNRLLCHLSADLRHFKQITMGHTVVMGRNTFFSLPKHPLPGRQNLVLTDVDDTEGAVMLHSIDEIVTYCREHADEEVFCIGGASVYRQLMPYADRLYITHIHHSFEPVDVYFPDIDARTWRSITCEDHFETDEATPYPYSFVEYVRR